MRRLAPVALLALALAGCGAAERQSTNTSASAADRVVIELQPQGQDGDTEQKVVSCDAVNDACKKLRAADFSETGREACAQVYGGPATATVTGKAGGKAIKTEFTLTNSCEIDRWREFAWLLGDPPA